jgi:adenylate cyclase
MTAMWLPSRSSMDERHTQSLIDWLIERSLAGTTERDLLAGLCERLVQAGIPLLRVSTATQLLHPTAGGQGVIWRRDNVIEQESFPRSGTPEGDAMRRVSPFDHLIVKRLPSRRWRFDDTYRAGEFPLLDTLRAQGATEYFALVVEVGAHASLSAARDIALSWAIDRPGGFHDSELALIERLTPALTFAANSARNVATGRALLDTYLGSDAAERVLSGNVLRGQAEAIRAAVWFSDLTDFTRIADGQPADAMLALLNDYAGCLTEAIHAQGGQVLKFVGDGILAIFRDDEQSRACSRALDAASRAAGDVRLLNGKRCGTGQTCTGFTLALHFGDLLYGNFGGRTRLDFTALGPAVNEASRINDMCRSLDQRVIVSSAFAGAAGNRRAELVSLGRYALKGVVRHQELFTLESGMAEPQGA